MTGKDYRAVERLSDREDRTLADVGQTCERVPAHALGWLLEQRRIELIVQVPEPTSGAEAPEMVDDDREV